MEDTITIRVGRATYAKLQRLAALAGSESAAIERLIALWERGQEAPVPPDSAPPSADAELWRSPGGDVLPVGTPLEAPYGDKTYHAIVETHGIRYEGKLYASPTAAARAVKKRASGLVGTSASTNGRDFWRVRDPKSGRLVPLSRLNPGPAIDSQQLLKEIKTAI